MFLQIHTLTSYSASLLNRDDAGLAKRIPFGNATRLRVSSQCLKRHWREHMQSTIPLPTGIRTRHFFEREILKRLVDEERVPQADAEMLTRSLMEALLQKSAASSAKKTPRKKEKPAAEQYETGEESPVQEIQQSEEGGFQVPQPILFGKPEADYLVKLLKDCAAQGPKALDSLKKKLDTNKQNFKAMMRQAGCNNLYAGLEGALFGRFVTSDILSRADACVHVAHSFTVHRLDTEVDYFTVVDDLSRDEETGAAHAGDMELGAGLFYGYVTVDVPLLVSNLFGCEPKKWEDQDPTNACAILKGLIQAIATVSPGAKLGSTAPYAYSDFVLLETGKSQPRTLANAYLEAMQLRGDPMQEAVNRLAEHLKAIDGMYGRAAEHRAAASTRNLDPNLCQTVKLNDAIDSALKSIFGEGYHESVTSPV